MAVNLLSGEMPGESPITPLATSPALPAANDDEPLKANTGDTGDTGNTGDKGDRPPPNVPDSGSSDQDEAELPRMPNKRLSVSLNNFNVHKPKKAKENPRSITGILSAMVVRKPSVTKDKHNGGDVQDGLPMSELVQGVQPTTRVKSIFQIRKQPTKTDAIVADYANLTRSLTTDNLDELDEVKRKNANCQCKPLYPHGTANRLWDYTITFFLFVALIYDPLRCAILQDFSFEPVDNWTGIELFLDIMFFLDIVVGFRVAFKNEDGETLTSCRDIALHYVKTRWFYLDLVCCLPFDGVLHTAGVGRNTVALLMLTKVFRLFKFQRSLHLHKMVVPKNISNSRSASQLKRFIGMVLRVFLGAHWFACLFFFVSVHSQSINGIDSSWVEVQGVEDADPTTRYISSVYWAWATITSTGYGDITAENQAEMLFSCFGMVFGIAAVAYGTATVSSVLQSMDIKGAKQQENAGAMKNFLHHAHLPRQLHDRVRRHLEFTMSHAEEAKSMQRFFLLMPSDLQATVAKTMYGSLLEAVPFLKKQEDTFVSQFLISLHAVQYGAGERFAEQGKASMELFLLKKGHVYYTTEGKIVANYFPGSLLGLVPLITGAWPCDAYVMVHSTLLSISKRRLAGLFTEYPKAKDQLMALGKERLSKMKQKFASEKLPPLTESFEGNAAQGLREMFSPTPLSQWRDVTTKRGSSRNLRHKGKGKRFSVSAGIAANAITDMIAESKQETGPPHHSREPDAENEDGLPATSATTTITTTTSTANPRTTANRAATTNIAAEIEEFIPGSIPSSLAATPKPTYMPSSQNRSPMPSSDGTAGGERRRTVPSGPPTRMLGLYRSREDQQEQLDNLTEDVGEIKDAVFKMMDQIQNMAQLVQEDRLMM